MARIAGVDIPDKKRGVVALTYVYGVGRSLAKCILTTVGVDENKLPVHWSDEEARKIRAIIGAQYKVEGELRAEVRLSIKRLMDIGSYRGKRHRVGLPVRSQRTKNNARTRKGKRKTVAGKKRATK